MGVLVGVRVGVAVGVGVGVCVGVAVGIGVAVFVGVAVGVGVGVAVGGTAVGGAWTTRVGVGAEVAGPQAAKSKDSNTTMSAAMRFFPTCEVSIVSSL